MKLRGRYSECCHLFVRDFDSGLVGVGIEGGLDFQTFFGGRAGNQVDDGLVAD